MYSARECARRYRLEGGRGDLTIMFHGWACGQLRSGDSWHCPDHQTDICQDCGGGISRSILPRTWYEEPYRRERGMFNPPLALTPSERESSGDLAKGKRKGGHPAPERMVKEARHAPDDRHEPVRGGGRAPDHRRRRYWSSHLVPVREENRGRDWFVRKSHDAQRRLKRLLGPTGRRSKDFTTKSWMDALSLP